MGFTFLPLVAVPHVWILSRVANPLLVLGRIYFLMGTLRFFDTDVHKRAIGALFGLFLVAYYFYMYGRNDLSAHTVIVSAAIAACSLMTAQRLFFHDRKAIAASSLFTGSVFLIHACYLIVVILFTLLSKPVHSYLEYSPLQVAVFIVPIVTSTLWTFGFILMVNQRLSAENVEEKENQQQVSTPAPTRR